MQKIRIVVIGCGLISKFHMDAIQENPAAELAGVYDTIAEAAQQAAQAQNTCPYHKLEDIWADETVDAVCICTPSGTHGPIALDAIAHNKHVLIEKPMALTREECDRIVSEATRKQRIVGVVSQLRFSPAIQQAKQAVEAGLLGKLISVELNMKYYRAPAYFSGSTWRGTKAMDGGGALMNQGIHGVDLLQYIAGMPTAVFAQHRTLLHDIEVEDTLHSVLMYENGALGTLIATTSVYPGFSRELTLCGENGTIILEEDSIKYWNLKDGTPQPESRKTSIQGTSDPGNIGSIGHVKQLANFVNAILGQETIFIDAAEGCKPLNIIWSIYQSAEENSIVRI